MTRRLWFALSAWLLLSGCGAYRRAGDLAVEVDAPKTLAFGRVAEIRVVLRNNGSAPLVVRDLDLQRTLLGTDDARRLAVVCETPHEKLELHDYRTYRVNLELEPGASQTVVFRMSCHSRWRPGPSFAGETLRGHLDVSLESFHNHTVPLEIAVAAPRRASG